MTKRDKDEAREERIMMEIVVDCYDEDERAMGWKTYLGEMLQFPFQAKCIEVRRVSPLEEGERVPVTDIVPLEDPSSEFFAEIEWGGRKMGVSLSQLEGVDVDKEWNPHTCDVPLSVFFECGKMDCPYSIGAIEYQFCPECFANKEIVKKTFEEGISCY